MHLLASEYESKEVNPFVPARKEGKKTLVSLSFSTRHFFLFSTFNLPFHPFDFHSFSIVSTYAHFTKGARQRAPPQHNVRTVYEIESYLIIRNTDSSLTLRRSSFFIFELDVVYVQALEGFVLLISLPFIAWTFLRIQSPSCVSLNLLRPRL